MYICKYIYVNINIYVNIDTYIYIYIIQSKRNTMSLPGSCQQFHHGNLCTWAHDAQLCAQVHELI